MKPNFYSTRPGTFQTQLNRSRKCRLIAQWAWPHTKPRPGTSCREMRFETLLSCSIPVERFLVLGLTNLSQLTVKPHNGQLRGFRVPSWRWKRRQWRRVGCWVFRQKGYSRQGSSTCPSFFWPVYDTRTGQTLAVRDDFIAAHRWQR